MLFRSTYAPSTLEQYSEHLEKYNLPEFVIQHFLATAVDYQNAIFSGTDGVIKEITGKAPQTVAEFVQANRESFEA